MKCDTCGHNKSEVYDTRNEGYKIVRKRRCTHCEATWVTVEVYRHATKNDKIRTRTDNASRWGPTREARNLRDLEIARRLHDGWEPLAKEFNLTKTAVYYAAARGRSLAGLGHQNARSYKKDK